MRIWDIPTSQLCRKHLLGEHRELHAIWTVLTTDKKGYRKHPETLRWEGKLLALFNRHEEEVEEMNRRNYAHHSPLDRNLASGDPKQTRMVHTIEEQVAILREKGCECFL